MDPDTTLQDILEALSAGEWDRVDELSSMLLGWLEKNGFPPTSLGDAKLGKRWHRSIATFVCYAAQSYAQKSRTVRKRST